MSLPLKSTLAMPYVLSSSTKLLDGMEFVYRKTEKFVEFRNWKIKESRNVSGQSTSAVKLQPHSTSAIDNFGY
jgi:hypothetical protein